MAKINILFITSAEKIGGAERTLLLILENLDTIQVNIWSKIIIRDSGTVTEVDGAKYRRTLDFNASSKLINS